MLNILRTSYGHLTDTFNTFYNISLWADVGATRHGGHAALLRLPLLASLAGPGGGCGLGPSTPAPPTLSLSLVCGSSQLPDPADRGREVNGLLHRMFC